MKSHLSHLVTLVLAVLVGTFLSVRGYLSSLEPPRRATDVSEVTVLEREGLPVGLEAYPDEAAVEGAVTPGGQDEDCPTCVMSDGLGVDFEPGLAS